MKIKEQVAKTKVYCQAVILDVCNVANRAGLLKDDKVEALRAKHTLKLIDALEHVVYNQ